MNPVYILFFASGISALIYEVVWLRMLSTVLGVTTYAASITLAAFMSGIAAGSFAFGKLSDKRKDPLRIYAFLQIAIALSAISVPILLKMSMPLYKYFYSRSLISFSILLIPSALMGGTLPILASLIASGRNGFGKQLSILYGLNTLGGVSGVLISGFITIGWIGEWNTILVGAMINLAVGIISLRLYLRTKENYSGTDPAAAAVNKSPDTVVSPYASPIRNIVLVSIMISGFTALAYEVIWSRQLVFYLATSIYAFSGMLAVYLAGIASGSLFMNKFIDRFKRPLAVLGIMELAVGLISLFNIYVFPLLDSGITARLLSPAILVFPVTFLFGAIFPIASLCYTRDKNNGGSSVGTLSGFNTIGNVAGALITGFFLIVSPGSTRTIILLSILNMSIGFGLLWLEPNRPLAYKMKTILVLPLAIILIAGLAGKDPFLRLIEKRIARTPGDYHIYLNKECIEGTLTSYEKKGFKYLLVNGKGQTKLCTETKLMAHLPMMLSKDPKKLLAICFGMGTTVRSAAIYKDLDITAVELVPEIYDCFKYYHSNAADILNRDNLHLIAADGRNFLLLAKDKYDIITLDPPLPIHSAGTVNFYSRDFLELCKERLTPDGIICLWFPFGAKDVGGTKEDVLYVLKSFYSVFPDMTVWSGPHGWGFYLIGTLSRLEPDTGRINNILRYPGVMEDIKEYRDYRISGEDVLKLLIMKPEKINEVTRNTPAISDDHPYTEFPLLRSLNKEGIRKLFE